MFENYLELPKSYGKCMAVLSLLLALFITQCQKKDNSEYYKKVETELAKGIRNDSLFLGYHFGMVKKDFFDHSWDLNKKQIIQNGNGAEILQNVEELKASASKIFYPDFKDDKIVRMPVKYSYDGWAPWNRHLWADSLKYDVMDLLERKYDIKFTESENPKSGKKYFYHISGNKEIRIQELNQSEVLVLYSDLTKIN